MTNTILIIDDYIELYNLLRNYLTPEGFIVEAVHDGLKGVEQAVSGQHSLILLDVMLQNSLRAAPCGDCSSKADCWIGVVKLITATRSVLRDGVKVELTSVEFAILEVLMQRAGQVLSRDELVKHAIGRNLFAYDSSVDVHVNSLRKKLGTDNSDRIKTIRSVGYLYFDRNEHDSNRLNDLISQLLMLTRLENNNTMIQKTSIDIAKTPSDTHQRVRRLKAHYERKNQSAVSGRILK
ncbi:MAG: response regulator transcription factor [Nitrospirota bacterium]